jgi:hypothetical protein
MANEQQKNKTTGGPAFPRPGSSSLNGSNPGMTLRQYYVGCAIQGLCARKDSLVIEEGIGIAACKIADAAIFAEAK